MVKEVLSQFKQNDLVVIKGINCGRNFSRRLCDLGLFEGSEVRIIKNDNFGPIVIQVLHSKIALGRGEAEKIYAEKK